MITTSENATQKSMTGPLLSVHHISFFSCGLASLATSWCARSHPPRFVAALSGAGLPFSEISASSPRSFLQTLAGDTRVVAAVEVDARPIRQPSEGLGDRVEGPSQQRRVVAALAGAVTVPRGMPEASTALSAFDASFAPVHGAFPGFLASARGLGDAPVVDGHVAQLQPDETIVGIEGDVPEPLHQPQPYPLITPATQCALQCALRASLVGDPPVGASEHQDLDQLLEDHPVGDTLSVATERMIGLSLW
jgi:hypothetical protein